MPVFAKQFLSLLSVLVFLSASSFVRAAELYCPPLFTDSDEVVCAVANYNQNPGKVSIRITNGANGSVLRQKLNVSLGGNRELNVKLTSQDPPDRRLMCRITVPNKNVFRGTFSDGDPAECR